MTREHFGETLKNRLHAINLFKEHIILGIIATITHFLIIHFDFCRLRHSNTKKKSSESKQNKNANKRKAQQIKTMFIAK